MSLTPFIPNLTITPCITCTVTNVQSDQGQVNVLTLYSQNPESESTASIEGSTGTIAESYISPIDLPTPVTLVINTPMVTGGPWTFTTSSTPGIAHVTGSGQYQIAVQLPYSTRYSYVWLANNQEVYGGEFSAANYSLP
jgi:hypothetical protein